MKSAFAAVISVLCLAAVPAVSQAQATPILGQIMIFSGSFCPAGWAVTDGSLLPIQQNIALFSILGTTYGGDGVHTFALPKTQPIYTQTRAIFTECIAISGVFPSRN